MLDALPLPALLLLFALAGAVVWWAGKPLADATDALDKRFGLDGALGGLILLALATNLPEIAITVSAALSGRVDVAAGNLLGGIALQTVVLVLLDGLGPKDKPPLTARLPDLSAALMGALVVGVLGATLLAAELPKSLVFLRVTPGGLLVVLLWIVGVRLVGKASKSLPWKPDPPAEKPPESKAKPPARPFLTFGLGALATLVAGYVLETAGDGIAKGVGMTGPLFGATVLAAATSLPEVATGLASLKNGEEAQALGDIFGGNAFLPTLFVLASLLSGKAALEGASPQNRYLAALGVLVTVPYVFGATFRSRRKVGRLGLDSLAVLAFYAVGVLGLIVVGK